MGESFGLDVQPEIAIFPLLLLGGDDLGLLKSHKDSLWRGDDAGTPFHRTITAG